MSGVLKHLSQPSSINLHQMLPSIFLEMLIMRSLVGLENCDKRTTTSSVPLLVVGKCDKTRQGGEMKIEEAQ
jgi:hypothetical protein